jgi:hypothetical protein
MKLHKISSLITLCVLLASCATTANLPQEQRQVQKIFDLPGLSQKQIYDKANEWMSKTYVSSKDVIQLRDPENGKIIGRGVSEFTRAWVKIPAEYLITIETKDGKLRVTCDQIVRLYDNGSRGPMETEGELNQVKDNLSNLITDLYSFVKENKQDSW